MRYVIWFIASIVISSVPQAQPVDTLIREGLQNNRQIGSFRFQREAADARADAAGALPAPTLGVEFSQVPTSSANVVNDAIANNFSLSQMFMLGGKLSAMAEVERRKGSVIDQNRAGFEARLRGQIRMAYARLWLLDRQGEIRRQSIRLLEQLTQSIGPRVVTNRARGADLLSAQAEAASERVRLAELEAQRSGVLQELNALLGRADLASPVTTDSLLTAFPSSLDLSALESDVTRRNPELAAMEKMTEMNDAMISSARKDLIPDLMLQAMIMRMPNGMILTSGERSMEPILQSMSGMPMQKTEWMYSIMASITLPFMPWSAERSTAKAEELRLTNLSIGAERDAMERTMLASFRAAALRFTSGESLAIRYEQDILPLMRQAADAQTLAYQNGQAPISALLDARRMELMKRDDYFMTMMNRQMALAEMEMMVGSPLTTAK